MENILNLFNDNNFEDIIKVKDFNIFRINGNNLLHLSAIRGNKKSIDYFLDNKLFNYNDTNDNGSNIIHLLFEYGWDELANKYYTIYPDLLYTFDSTLYVPMFYCIERFDTFIRCFNFIKKNNKEDIINDVSVSNDNIVLKLIDLSKNKKEDIYYKYIVDNIDIINFAKPKLMPVLIYCIFNNKNLLAEYFIKNNKGINNRNNIGLLPIHMACSKNNIEIVELLMDKDVDINYGGIDNEYLPINIAINHDYLDLLDILVKYVKIYSVIDKYRNTYLHYIADKLSIYAENNKKDQENRLKKYIKIFIKNSDIDIKNNDGITPRQIIKYYIKLKSKSKNKDSEIKNINSTIDSIDNNNIISDVDIIKTKTKYNSGLFNSDIIHNMLYCMYLLNKYDNLAIPYQEYNKDEYTKTMQDLVMQNLNYNKYYSIIINILTNGMLYLYTLMPSIIIWKDKDLNFIHKDLFNIIDKIYKNKTKRFILIKVTFVVSESFTHANVILIDTYDKSVRRFEPYGVSNVDNEKDLDEYIEDKMKKIFDNVTYYKPGDYLDIAKFQAVSNDAQPAFKKTGDPAGYCLAWCFWYIELKLNNNNLSELDLITNATKKISHYYKNTDNPYLYFIRDYARNLNNQKDKILKKIKINKNEYYDLSYKVDNLRKIFNYMNKYFS